MQCTDCRRSVEPVVAVDIDGTLADWHTAFLHFAGLWLGDFAKVDHWMLWDGRGELSDFMGLDKELYRSIKLHFRQGGFKRWMKPYPWMSSLINGIHELDAELWITTTRPYLRLDNLDPDTREWLSRQGVEYKGLIYDEDKYGRLGEAVGAERVACVVENEGNEYRRALALGFNPILRRTSFNRGVLTHRHHGKIIQAHGFGEVLQLVTEYVEKWRAEHG